jgi:hypothetical protein
MDSDTPKISSKRMSSTLRIGQKPRRPKSKYSSKGRDKHNPTKSPTNKLTDSKPIVPQFKFIQDLKNERR